MRKPSRCVRLIVIVVLGLGAVIAAIWLYSEYIVDRSISKATPCEPPCWHDIAPGTSITQDEVIQLLKTLPSVDHWWVSRISKQTAVNWYWRHWPWRKWTGYSSILLEADRVESIDLAVDFRMTVGDVLESYGEPQVVNTRQVGLPQGHYLAIDLFYPSRGLRFRIGILGSSWILNEETTIERAVFFDPVQSLDRWLESDTSPERLMPWAGYGDVRQLYDP